MSRKGSPAPLGAPRESNIKIPSAVHNSRKTGYHVNLKLREMDVNARIIRLEHGTTKDRDGRDMILNTAFHAHRFRNALKKNQRKMPL
jgi:hypothetical protein